MSNKLIKRSPDYRKVKEWLREKADKEGGVNITTELMSSEECGSITYNEFIDILGELSDEGYNLFKVEKACNGIKTGGMMICRKDVVIAFVKDRRDKKKDKEKDPEFVGECPYAE